MIERTEKHWSNIAGESVEVEEIGGAVYGFASELAVRRLADKMHAGRVGYSPNLQSWFFVNE